jgi:threonine dehydratase
MVRLIGESYTETQAHAYACAAEENRTFIAPYDDPLTIAGQGTIGVEILKQLGSGIERLDAIFVAIGGGGLIAGIAAYVKALKPDVKIIGAEPTGANCMAQSLRRGQRVTLSRVDAFADGVAVKSVGAARVLPAALPAALIALGDGNVYMFLTIPCTPELSAADMCKVVLSAQVLCKL